MTALAVGQWTQLPNTALSSVDPTPLPSGSPAAKVNAWNSFSIDTRTSTVFSAANGGHADYAGNEVDALELEHVPPRWVALSTPSTQLADSPYYPDGKPGSRHSYYGAMVDEVGNRVMAFGGSRWRIGWTHEKVDSFRLNDHQWNPAGTHPDFPSSLAGVVYAFATCKDSRNGNIYLFGNYQIARWSPTTNQLTVLTMNGIYGNETACSFDSLRNRFLLVGGKQNEHHTYSPDTGTLSPITLSGNTAAVQKGDLGMSYVPAIDTFLVRGADAGGAIATVNPSTFAVGAFPTTGGTTIPHTLNGPFNKFLCAPRLRGCVYVPTHDGNAWFLRTH